MTDADSPEVQKAAKRPAGSSGRSVRELFALPRDERTPEEQATLDQLTASVNGLGSSATRPLADIVAKLGPKPLDVGKLGTNISRELARLGEASDPGRLGGVFARLGQARPPGDLKLEPPMGQKYIDLINSIEQQRAAAVKASTIKLPVPEVPAIDLREWPEVAMPFNAELETMIEVRDGIEKLGVAQREVSEAQVRALESIGTAATLIGNLDTTIRQGNRGSYRLAAAALILAFVGVLPTLISIGQWVVGQIAIGIARLQGG